MPDEKNKKYPFLDAEDDPVDDTSDAPARDTANGQSSGDSSPDDLYFERDGVGERLRHADPDTLDAADFGIIKIDDEGVVEFFNQWESDLSGVAKDEAEGRNFFTQVAPCTNNRLFRGRFKKGVRRGELDESFTYTYTYKMRPTLVEVHLYRDEAANNWIMVQKY